ncbi:serine/arginine repetitive matrix protein 1-like [Myxocyprinus asiaticus]|uniref:serine/arginine repetitive matrix protein 1-like n=1 Tax=Myxocyprinus asiaticus TaxID=70543 RepID=UPI002223EB71|nr:serine/arginine repetitive matrix protein 1-like [Myxocyprinus asiaticus]XP_051520741.1 serine/arginine repetitive matrix protein 1-like [Myxocyprinus asiaticus]
MVRPHSGSPHSKHRSFSDSYSAINNEGRFGPPSRSQRGFRGPPGKAPPSWRESNSGGPQPYPKRPPLMGERRERQHGHWMQQNQDNFRSYPSSHDSQRGRRRPSPPRSSRPPPVQHRQSPHGPIHGPPSHRAPFFRGNHSSHASPSRNFHGPPSKRRVPSPHSSFRGPQRRPSPSQEHQRSWCPAPRERPFGRPTLGRQHWNGPGGYSHPPSGESRFSGPPQRKPREFHGRISYPERWSAERDQHTQHGEVGRESRRPSQDWAHGGGSIPHSRPPYRSPARKPGLPSSGSSPRGYPPLRPQERLTGHPLKRKSQDFRRPPFSGFEHGPPKRFRRELSVRPVPLRGFRGRGLSLSDKSRLLKTRKFRAESVARFKLPPPRPGISDRVQKPKPLIAPKNNKDSTGVQPRKVPLRKGVKMPSPRESSHNMSSKTAEPERDNETKVESRRSVSAHSSASIDRRLSRDLVVVSRWEAGHKPSTSPKNSAPWRNRAPKNKTESSDSYGNLTLNERFTKLQSPTSSSQEHKERRPSGSPEKNLSKPGSFQRPNFHPTVGLKRGSAPDGISRKLLMASIIPRPPFNQKPVFKKSQSIMSKYKNLQTLRHKAPHQRQATSYRRW